MTTSSHHKVITIIAGRGGITTRSAPDIKGMITELMENSGIGVALWIEKEATRVAQLWRDAEKEREQE